MEDIKTPDSIIRELSDVKNKVAQNAGIIQDCERAFLEADRDFRREYAMAYKRAQGSVEDRKQQATIDTDSFAHARDDALIALNYAKTRSRSFETIQTNLQTQARLVEITFRLAGMGER